MSRSHKTTERLQEPAFGTRLQTELSRYYTLVSESYFWNVLAVFQSQRGTQSRQKVTSHSHLTQKIGKRSMVHGHELRMNMDDRRDQSG